MDYIYAELNDDIRDTYYTGYLSGSSDEENIGVVVDIDNRTHKISADLSEATKELLATHGDEIVRVEGRLDEEISRAENAEAELLRSLTEEIQATEEKLSSDLDREVARARAEEASLSRRLSDLKSETNLLAAELTNESEVRLREDVVLTSKITAEVQRAEAEESRIETTLGAALNTAESNLNNRIAGEELARVTADNNLNASIENVSTQLTNKIEGEASERALAIEGVTAQLTAEGDTRRAEDNSIRTLIQEEAAISRSEESKLSTQINNAVARLQLEDAKIRASLSEELMARTEADNNLSAGLSAEIADRKAADTAIIERLDIAEDDIDALEGRATAIEGRLDVIEGEGEGSVKKALADARAYANGIVATEKAAREAKDSELEGKINENAAAISNEATARESADTAIKDRLDVIEGTSEGSIKKALQDAKDYVDGLFGTQDIRDDDQDSSIAANKAAIEKEVFDRDSAISGVVADYKAADLAINDKIGSVTEGKTVVEMIGDARTTAENYADSKASAAQAAAEQTASSALSAAVQTLNTKDAELVTEDARLADLINTNTAAINKEIEDRASAVKEVSDKVDVEKVSTAITTAKSEAIAAAKSETDEQVSTLTEKVNKNTGDISTLSGAVASEIARVEGLVSTEATNRENADNAINERLESVEAFFKTTEGETLDGALDTLKEIQDYLNGEGDAAGGIIDRIAQAETDIDNLQKEFDTETGRVKVAEGKITALESRATAVEGRATTLEGKVATLEAKPFDTYATKTEVNAVSDRAELGVTNAATAQSAADKAQDEIDALEDTVSTLRGEYNITKALATANEAAIGALDTRVGTVEGKVSTLETESAKHALKTEVEAELANKVNASDYNAAIGNVYTKDETDSKFGLKIVAEKNTTDISTNASNITALTNRLTAAESDIDALEPKVTTLQDIVAGYSAKGSIKTAIEAAQTAADNAQIAADTAQGEVDTLDTRVAALEKEYEPLVTLTTTNAVDSVYRIANVVNSNFLSTPFEAGDCLKVHLKINDQVYEGWVVGAEDSTGVITSKNPMGSYGDSGLGGLFDGTSGYFAYVLPSATAGGTSFSDLALILVTLNAEVSYDSSGSPVATPKSGSIAIVAMFGNSTADSDPTQLKISVSKSIVLAEPMTLAGQAFVFSYNDDATISVVTPKNTSLVNFGDGSVEYYPSENTILTHSYTPSDFGIKPNALHIYGDIKHLPDNFLKGAVCLTSFELTKARTFGESAFENCVNLVCAVMHPETATISKNAFKGCTSLKDIDLRGVTTIAESAFENCSALTSITLPDSLRQIEANAFKGTGLTTVVIPAGVTTIADTAFDSTTKLITASELSYLDGVTSNIQAQLDTKGTSNFTGYTSSNKLAASNVSGLSAVATSGNYTDLSDKPSINGVEITGAKTSADLKLGEVTASGGFQAGTNASTTSGGAVGEEAAAESGGAVGYQAKETGGGGAVGQQVSATSGGAIGWQAKETAGGGAVGHAASTTLGGAVGYQATASTGFAGGYGAKARYAADGVTSVAGAVAIGDQAVAQANNAVQLGIGTNTNEGTLKFRNYQLVDADGKIPVDRLPDHSHVISNIAGLQSALDGKQNIINSSNKLAASNVSGLATVAISGSYNDLSNKPTNYVTTDGEQAIDGNKTYTGTNTFSNGKFSIRANAATDDSWIQLTNSGNSAYYAFGIRRPYTNYGLQLKYHPDKDNQDPSRPGDASGTDDIYYDIYHQGNYTKIPGATTSTAGLMSAADKVALDGMTGGNNLLISNSDWCTFKGMSWDVNDSSAGGLSFDSDNYCAHLELGVDAGCDILLSEDAGQAGQVLTSAGPNATPYWSNMPKFDYDPETKVLIIS